jgi:predicted PurR-regulated permease PerM
MKLRDKIIFIVIALVIFSSLIYLIKSVIAPFISSLVIAYFLDPLVDRLHEKYKLSRLAATSLIMGLFVVSFVGICSVLLPIIYTQFMALLDALPDYLQTFTNDLYPKIAAILNRIGFGLQTDFSHLIEDQQISAQFIDLSKNIFSNALDSSLTLINILSLIFITPILIFYLLKDWDILIKKIHDFLPRNISASAKEIAREIDKALSGYVRGQFNVCFILGVLYSSLLSFSGLNFGFLIGFLTGLFSFIPYVGMLSGVTAAIAVALFQWGFDIHIAYVAAIFIFGQIIESNFLTPKLIGSKIGLHPVWMIFGLFIFGALFGFIGVVIAVPLTAVCGTIIKHFSTEYKKHFT